MDMCVCVCVSATNPLVRKEPKGGRLDHTFLSAHIFGPAAQILGFLARGLKKLLRFQSSGSSKEPTHKAGVKDMWRNAAESPAIFLYGKMEEEPGENAPDKKKRKKKKEGGKKKNRATAKGLPTWSFFGLPCRLHSERPSAPTGGSCFLEK